MGVLLSCLIRASHGLSRPRIGGALFCWLKWVSENTEGPTRCAMRMGQVRQGRGAVGGVWGGCAGGGRGNGGARLSGERGGTATARPNGDGAGWGRKKFPHNGNMFPGFFHTMERCFAKFSTQWKHVSGTFPHNGNMFRAGFPRCGNGGRRRFGEGGKKGVDSVLMSSIIRDR